jgi:hypothetical protein
MSSNEEITITLGDDELTVEVAFDVYGTHMAATRVDPEEWPVLEIESITVVCDEAEGGFDEGLVLAHGVLDEDAIDAALWELKADRDREYDRW